MKMSALINWAATGALSVTEAQAIRVGLTAALEAVWEARATLEKYRSR